jgi:hypothetical protein
MSHEQQRREDNVKAQKKFFLLSTPSADNEFRAHE